ncbi:MAG: hypothetical protein KDA65_14650 [Planctomycetaceae bacterium]|nr:hypothetical protein [Planctomycetaceae bacterium]
MLTITIIGILSAVAMPRFSTAIEAQRVKAAAKRIKADLELASRYARSNNLTETITFNTGDHSYSFSSYKDINHQSEVYTIWLNDTPYETTIQTLTMDGNSIAFNAYGIPDRGLTITVINGSLTKTITLEEVTGRVVIQD